MEQDFQAENFATASRALGCDCSDRSDRSDPNPASTGCARMRLMNGSFGLAIASRRQAGVPNLRARAPNRGRPIAAMIALGSRTRRTTRDSA
jgi:hypothetical protein